MGPNFYITHKREKGLNYTHIDVFRERKETTTCHLEKTRT